MKLTSKQLKQIIKEEFESMTSGQDPQRFLHGFESGHPHDDEGYMIKSRMSDVKEMAGIICGLLQNDDQLPAWVQDLIASAHTDLEHVKDYLSNDEKMRRKGSEHSMFHTSVPSSDEMMSTFEESRSRRGGMLLEGHARITPEEMSAWMNGDWGYVAENTTGMGVYEEEDVCKTCGEKISDEEMKSHSHECGSFYK